MKKSKWSILLGMIAGAALLVGSAGCDLTSGNSGNSGNNGAADYWTMETVFAKAQELGYEGTLEAFMESIKGANGKDGVGIKGVYISEGSLFVELTEGEPVNCGAVKGADGENGKDGKDGVSVVGAKVNEKGVLILELSDGKTIECGEVKGAKGEDGKDGANGANGENGKDGVGLSSAAINEKGELELTFTDGNKKNLGVVVGAKGDKGENGTNGTNGEDGKDGVGVQTVEINENGELVITLTNNTVLELGKVVGENGKDGTNGTNGKDGDSVSEAKINENGELVLTFVSGKSLTVGNVVGAAGKDGANGTNGENGKDGVGVQTVEINADGELVITLTNNTVLELGKVVGENGKDGTNGTNGKDGDSVSEAKINENGELVLTFVSGKSLTVGNVVGAAGKDGTNGTNGENGKDGVGVQTVEINENGELVITLTNEKEINLGNVKGAKGEDGKDGADGVSITGVTINDAGELVITLSEGSPVNLGSVKGEKGDKGETGDSVSGAQINENGELVLTFESGKTVTAGSVKGENGVGISDVKFNENGELIVVKTDGTQLNLGKIPVCNHQYSEWTVGIAATCNSIGFKTRECEICGQVDYEFVAAMGHSYGDWTDDVSTCTTHWQVRTCEECGQVDYKIVAAMGHSYGEWTDVVSTCTTRWQVRVCTVCGESQTASAAPKGHNYVNEVCTDCGLSEWDRSNLSYLDAYNGTYGYTFLGTMEKGEALQSLYTSIDGAVRLFHANTKLDAAEDLSVATIDYAALGLTIDEAVAVWKTYKDDNPLYYWLSNTVSYTDGSLILLTESEYAEGRDRKLLNELIYGKIEEYAARLGKNDTAYQKALGYHDFILYAVDYAYNASGEPETAAWAHNVLGVFEETGAVCEGYARSFQLLLNYSGVENLFVTGSGGGEDHAWNLVRLDDGNWYWYDLTWDDAGSGWKWGIKYNYFCVTDDTNTIWSEGGWEYDYTQTFLQNHTLDTSTGSGVHFLYDLPERARAAFADGEQVLLNESFTAGACEVTVVGYNAVELNMYTGAGHVKIPESVVYGGNSYRVISLGREVNGSTDYVISANVTSVTIPKTVIFFWDHAFRSEYLENIYVDEENPNFRSQDGVLFTKSLYTLIQYPSANGRTEYSIPDETVDIAYWSFERCAYLEKLTIGKNVSSVWITNWGNGYHDSEPTGWFGGNIVEGGWVRIMESLTGNGKVIVPEENETYRQIDGIVYDADLTEIFLVGDKTVTSVTLPATVRAVDSISTADTIFASLPYLESISVEEGSEYFSSFGGILYNKDLTEIIEVPLGIKGEVVLADSLTSIDYGAFFGRKSLTSVIIPASVISIENSSFTNCFNLTSITIPESVASIGEDAFSSCSALMSVTLPANMTALERQTFEYCRSLTSITLPNGLTSIGEQVFMASGLTSITIPESVTSIGNGAFWNCRSLTSITIPEGVASIGDRAFASCSSLTRITIPENVTSIGEWAFIGCSSLTTVYYTGTAEEWTTINVYEGNEYLNSATVCYYSANDPFAGENAATDGNYWRYVNGEPVVWVKEDEQAAA